MERVRASTEQAPPGATATARRFDFAWDPRAQRASRLFGITPARCWVDVDTETLDANFGRWRLTTPVANVAAVEVTGPYRLFKVIGPPRLGITDLGITFGTNGRRGVMLTFHEKVAAIEPFGVMRHPELTVTLAEVDAFMRLIQEHAGLAS